ncbi:hypothetical protein AB0C76_03250 [Kitasatospora sp. NPDC048722]|uniref:hypothetical protein n=1 Tax=Kitasatospora sp. NPDC048722 TaxID=3155639 RepID=UPI00340103C7
MAEFKATAEMGSAFSKYPEMSALLLRMQGRVHEIDGFNTNAAGHDEIGNAYFETVDPPTKGLLKMLGQVSKIAEKAGHNGQTAAKLFTRTDDDLASGV